MPRRESTSDLILLRDNLSDSTLGIYYRQPTTKERQAYINRRQVRQGNKFVDNTVANRVASGKLIMTGLRDGDFERADGDSYRPISSSPGAENYYPNWADWMEEHCSDVLVALAIRVFELPVTTWSKEADEAEAGEDLEKE
jgi:hypothetical protein